nr:hypothetical protein [Tanacetum cinerariifolium]
MENLPKVGETNALSKPVTSNSVSTPQESIGVNNDKVIAPGMFRINPFKTSREEKHVPNTVSASTRVDNTKTRRPQPRSNTKHDRVPSASKSSRSKNKEAEVEEHHRNLLLSKNNKHISSAMCKKCLISVNHDECLRNYVNGKTSRGKKQKAKVSFKENQIKYQPKVMKPKKVKENLEKDKIGSKPDKKREAWRSQENSKAVTVDRGRKTEENAKRRAVYANTVKVHSSFKEERKEKGYNCNYVKVPMKRAISAKDEKMYTQGLLMKLTYKS